MLLWIVIQNCFFLHSFNEGRPSYDNMCIVHNIEFSLKLKIYLHRIEPMYLGNHDEFKLIVYEMQSMHNITNK